MTLEEKVKKVESVIRSCKNHEQVLTCILWIKKLHFNCDIFDSPKLRLYGRCNEMTEYLNTRYSKPESPSEESKTLPLQVLD